MAYLKLFIFGQPRLEVDGKPIELNLRKALALLAYLAASDQPSSRDALATMLWPESDGREGRGRLRRTLHRLQQAIGDDILDSESEAVCLSPGANLWLDSNAFRQEVTAGLAAQKNTNDRIVRLNAAVALYTQDFLAGFTLPDSPAFDEWQFFQRESLRQLYGQALEQLVQTYRAWQEWDQAVAYGRRWVALDPLHEPAQRLLMQLYAEAGRHAAALRQYGECVRVLDAELGAEPEDETTTLYEAIRSRQIGQAAPAAKPAPIADESFPSLIVMSNQLTFSHPTPFVGRTKEYVDITTRLLNPDCRLLTITGLGGSGKTRLAIEAATTVSAQFPHGMVFVALQPIARSDLLLSAISQAVGLTLYGEDDSHEQLFGYLHDKTLLLLLDNFEHLLDGAALVSSLLAAAPGVTVLATSREALRLQEEWLYPLQGLATPLSIYATSLEEYDAVQLFLSHAGRAQPAFDLVTEREAVIRICMMTAGLPLAIELAASWLKGLTATHIAQAMQHNLDVLSTTTRNVEARHRSMRAVFDQSWALLSESERLIFARLSVFRGGFTSDAAQQVAGAPFADLAALVEKSLIQLGSTDRFGIHELLRQYGIEKLEASGEADAAHERHSHYFAEVMLKHETALKQSEQLATMQAIERDFDNIRLAWEWSVEHRQAANLHMLLNSLYLFGFLGSRHVDTIVIFQETLTHPIADRPLLGRLLARRWGSLHWWFQAASDYQEALTSVEQALAIASAEHDDFEIAFCHLMASYALMGMRRYAEALPHLESSKTLFESLGEPYYVCWALSRLGYLYAGLNNPDKEIEYSEQSLALARGMHNRFALFSCLYNLGSDYILHGDYNTSSAYGAEALQFANETGQVCQISHGLSLLALRAFCEGDYSACQSYSDRSVTVIKDIILLVVQPYSLALLTLLACLREEYAEAIRINQLSKHHSVNAMGFQLNYWALAAISCGTGNLAEARTAIQNALQLTAPNIHPTTIIWIVPCAAYTLVATDPAQAVELLAWVFTYPEVSLNWARQWPLIDRLRARLQGVMDRDLYQRHWERGKTLTFERITSDLHHEFCAPADPSADATRHNLLTTREREILGLMATGMTNPQIAAQLVIGAGTVKTHTLNIYHKLEVANRTQAIVRAHELGILPT